MKGDHLAYRVKMHAENGARSGTAARVQNLLRFGGGSTHVPTGFRGESMAVIPSSSSSLPLTFFFFAFFFALAPSSTPLPPPTTLDPPPAAVVVYAVLDALVGRLDAASDAAAVNASLRAVNAPLPAALLRAKPPPPTAAPPGP